MEIVQINSPSESEGPMAEFVIRFCAERGIELDQDETGNLYFVNPGAKVLLTAHMDTVQGHRHIVPVLDDGIVRSSGDSILGADDKANLAAILCTVDHYYRHDIAYDFELLFTVQEELGMRGVKKADISRFHARKGITFDKSDHAFGSIVSQAPYGFALTLTMKGKSAHSGSPEQGINALNMAADFLVTVPPGGRGGVLTFNLGLISGGTTGNTVPGLVEMMGDIRGQDKDAVDGKFREIEAAMEMVRQKYPGGTVELKVEPVISGYVIDTESPFLGEVRKVLQLLGSTAALIPTTGGSDAAILNAAGIETLVIASGAYDVHTPQEHIAVADLENMVRFHRMLMGA